MSMRNLFHQSRHQAEQQRYEAITILVPEFVLFFFFVCLIEIEIVYAFCYALQKNILENILIKHLESIVID